MSVTINLNKLLIISLGIILILLFFAVTKFNNKEIKNIKNTKEISNFNKGINNNITQDSKKEDFCNKFIKSGKYYKVWSDTKPKINKTHILCGEINSKGKPTGLHSIYLNNSPVTIKIKSIKSKRNKYGIYIASIDILDIKTNQYKTKNSSIFPDDLDISELEKIIINAWDNKTFYKNSKFRGPSGLGFNIEGYTYKGSSKINTAYPIYTK